MPTGEKVLPKSGVPLVVILRRRDDYVDVRQSIDEVLDEEAQVKSLQDTYDPAEGEGQSAEHDDAKGVHRSIEIKVAYQLGGAVFVSCLHGFLERVVLHVVERGYPLRVNLADECVPVYELVGFVGRSKDARQLSPFERSEVFQ